MLLRDRCWLWGHPEGCFNAAMSPEKIEMLIADAREFENIKVGVFDDFKNCDGKDMLPRYQRFPIQNLYDVIERMHNNDARRLDAWMVFYTCFFKKLTPNNRRMFGCYLYDFDLSKQSTPELVKWQLDFQAYDVACKWLDEHGDEEVPDLP